jgi:nucleoside-diphosphate-sugar epimerase
VAPDAFSKAVLNVTSIIHVASPYHFRVTNNEKDLLIPAREGTLNILKAAAQEKSVKRVVITSSFAAMNQLGTDPYAEPPLEYDENVWNPVTWEEALTGAPRVGYQASKKFAELAALGNKCRSDIVNCRLCQGEESGVYYYHALSSDDLWASNSFAAIVGSIE